MIKIRRKFKVTYNKEELTIEQAEYFNGRYALQVFDRHRQPYAMFTTNIPAYDDRYQDPRLIFLDTNNCPGIKTVLEEAGYVKDTGHRVQSGYCVYPVVRWLM